MSLTSLMADRSHHSFAGNRGKGACFLLFQISLAVRCRCYLVSWLVNSCDSGLHWRSLLLTQQQMNLIPQRSDGLRTQRFQHSHFHSGREETENAMYDCACKFNPNDTVILTTNRNLVLYEITYKNKLIMLLIEKYFDEKGEMCI